MSTEQIIQAKRELDAKSPNGWSSVLIPFLDDDAGDYLCLDTSMPGIPVRGYYAGHDEHLVSPSLNHWLETFVEHVEKGDYREDPERGTFILQADS